jgi:hypothetical protein
MKIYRAYYDSRNFCFEAFAKSEAKAREKCLEALQIHTEQYNLEKGWFMFGDSDGIECDDYELDQPYRDREIVKQKELLEMRGD